MRAESGGRVTSADVARLAGVSRATVSYVVNDVPGVKLTPGTRERVLAAAAELGYSKYGPGRTLKSGRSDVVLFVLTDLPVGHALNALLDELEARLAEADLSLVLFRVSGRGNPISRIWREIGPSAAIGLDAIDDNDAREMRAAGIDVIRLVLRDGDEPGVLSQSQTDVGRAQVHHLANRGHRRLGFAYPDDARVKAFADLRLQGAMDAVHDLELPDLDVRTVPLERDGAAAAMLPWASGPATVTGICAYNDQTAFAVLAGLRQNGVRVPEDVAVIGVDNDPMGELVSPTLTTVDTRHVEVGDELARLVIASRENREPNIHAAPQRPKIIVRESAP